MPALGMAQETGRLLKWFRREGEAVQQGEPLMEIETDKVTVDIEAPASGVLAAVRAQEGDEVPVGRVIALILAPGEEPPSQAGAGAPAPGAAEAVRAGGAPEAAGPAPAAATVPGRIPASPKARRLAQERGVDLASLRGTGPEGSVVAADVMAAGAPTPAGGPVELTTVERLMAERTWQSWTEAPHFHLTREVDASRLVAWRQHLDRRRPGFVTYTDLLVRLAAWALRQHPRVNASWRDGQVVLHPDVHITLAVAADEGLLVPVIHHADRLSVEEIASRRAELVERARAGRLRPEDVGGGTFTISNLGMFGVDAFQAVLTRGQAALLAVGRIAPRPVAVDGQLTVRPTAVLSLACDHRVVDGARAARFLSTLAELVEEPLGLMG
jgi:pyruvate dehydrogenase E2 component (dihydrolipoamide acetyltransferase)